MPLGHFDLLSSLATDCNAFNRSLEYPCTKNASLEVVPHCIHVQSLSVITCSQVSMLNLARTRQRGRDRITDTRCRHGYPPSERIHVDSGPDMDDLDKLLKSRGLRVLSRGIFYRRPTIVTDDNLRTPARSNATDRVNGSKLPIGPDPFTRSSIKYLGRQ